MDKKGLLEIGKRRFCGVSRFRALLLCLNCDSFDSFDFYDSLLPDSDVGAFCLNHGFVRIVRIIGFHGRIDWLRG
ncbi:MAG: hypothetical protein ACKOA4_08995, partial [Haliscomenobacter sp.]